VRSGRHRLLPTSHDALGVAGLDGLRGEHDRLETRAAHLVDGERRNCRRKSRVYQGLPCRGLSRAALDHLTHDDLFHATGIDTGARNRLTDDHGAELGSGERGQTAEVAADRRADGGNDDWGGAIAHVVLVRFGFRCGEIRPKVEVCHAELSALGRHRTGPHLLR
jgi:hypothetical protein